MKKQFLTFGLGVLLCIANVAVAQQQDEKQQASSGEAYSKKDYPVLVLQGTHTSQTFSVTLKDLDTQEEVKITAPAGFSVSPSSIPAGTKNAKVTVTLLSSKKHAEGDLMLRSGDTRAFVKLIGQGGELPTKDLSGTPVHKGDNQNAFVQTSSDGFKPSEKGYTIEYKIKTDENSEFFPFVVNDKGIGFKGYVDGQGLGVFSASSKKGFGNPLTQATGGLGKFYNTDGKYHVYRYAVASDNRVFVYRDGLAVDTLRAQDLGPQEDFATASGDPVENLLKNPNFEGEFETRYDNKMAVGIEGWDIVIGDRYNSEQFIAPQEIDNEQDFNNHVLQMKRYKWSDGWGAAEIVQVVDVAPNETYTLQALVRGGIKKDGTLLGKMKIQEVQDGALQTSVDIAGDTWETYSLDYTTSENCKQIRVVFYLERDKWGADISPMEVDNVKLTGVSRTYASKIGFNHAATAVEYFTYDLSGAYAPAKVPAIEVMLSDKK